MTDGSIKKRASLIQAASITAILGNFALSALKISAGLYTQSLAVVGDGIDSGVDVFIAIMSLFVARVISRPADAEHPWGHGRAETIATALLSLTLFFAGGQLILSSAGNLLFGKAAEVPGAPALIVTAISIAGKLLLAWSQYLFGKKTGSAMLRANVKNMAGDVLISVAVLLGLFLSLLFNKAIIDSAVAVLVGFWVIRQAVGIFLEANAELMDGSSVESYRAVFEAVRSVEKAGNPHRTRMRRIAGLWDIDIDIEVNPDITVREAHLIATEVELAIKSRVEGVYDIMVHIEPVGDSGKHEGFGLREDTARLIR
ncbi:MAG: cation diffusion facilitator family transporter [Spirochaetaceae bacterium]|jgi:cation diffusion facilitator family transporter|nr:cation diffusion facilitator family transporter [Spirochaetaceae bacterium]